MKWDEFSALLSGLSGDSPLGRVVQIRLENDENMLKHFTPHQRKIRSLWRNRMAKHTNQKDYDFTMTQLKNMFLTIALGGEEECQTV